VGILGRINLKIYTSTNLEMASVYFEKEKGEIKSKSAG